MISDCIIIPSALLLMLSNFNVDPKIMKLSYYKFWLRILLWRLKSKLLSLSRLSTPVKLRFWLILKLSQSWSSAKLSMSWMSSLLEWVSDRFPFLIRLFFFSQLSEFFPNLLYTFPKEWKKIRTNVVTISHENEVSLATQLCPLRSVSAYYAQSASY